MFVEYTLKADINISSSGTNVILSSPIPTDNNLYYAIDHINLVPDAAVTLQIVCGSTNYGGAYSLTANQGFILENVSGDENGIITCGADEAFLLELSDAVQVSGFIKYRIRNQYL